VGGDCEELIPRTERLLHLLVEAGIVEREDYPAPDSSASANTCWRGRALAAQELAFPAMVGTLLEPRKSRVPGMTNASRASARGRPVLRGDGNNGRR